MKAHPAACAGLKQVLDIVSISFAVVTKPSPVRVWIEGMVDSEALGDWVLPRGVSCEAHRSEGHAVIAVPEGDDVVVAGVEPGHENSKVVGLRARVDKVDRVQVRGELGRELLAEGRELDAVLAPRRAKIEHEHLERAHNAAAHSAARRERRSTERSGRTRMWSIG